MVQFADIYCQGMPIHESASVVTDLEAAAERVRELLSEIRQGSQLLREGKRILMDRRFQLGTLLSSVRATFSQSGTGAAAWRTFLVTVSLRRKTANRYIRVAREVALRPELADRRSFQALYEEIGLERARNLGAGPATVPNVMSAPTMPPLEGMGAHLPTEGEVFARPSRGGGEDLWRPGRPRLSDEERRDDTYMVRCNTKETLRLRRLSGVLCMSDAEVFREGLLALEDREAQKTAALDGHHDERSEGKRGGLRGSSGRTSAPQPRSLRKLA